MATPHTTPSKLNGATTVTPTLTQDSLYITAILSAGIVTIDGTATPSAGPVALPSPIVCKIFIAAEVGQVAYFEQ